MKSEDITLVLIVALGVLGPALYMLADCAD